MDKVCDRLSAEEHRLFAAISARGVTKRGMFRATRKAAQEASGIRLWSAFTATLDGLCDAGAVRCDDAGNLWPVAGRCRCPSRARARTHLPSAEVKAKAKEANSFFSQPKAGVRAREGQPKRKPSAAVALALEFEEAAVQAVVFTAEGFGRVPDPVNTAAMAATFRRWLEDGIPVEQIRAMIAEFCDRPERWMDLRSQPPWKAFLAQRKALTDAVVTSLKVEERGSHEGDHGYWFGVRKAADGSDAAPGTTS